MSLKEWWQEDEELFEDIIFTPQCHMPDLIQLEGETYEEFVARVGNFYNTERDYCPSPEPVQQQRHQHEQGTIQNGTPKYVPKVKNPTKFWWRYLTKKAKRMAKNDAVRHHGTAAQRIALRKRERREMEKSLKLLADMEWATDSGNESQVRKI